MGATIKQRAQSIRNESRLNSISPTRLGSLLMDMIDVAGGGGQVPLTENLLIEVGTGGNFATLSAALAECSNYYPVFGDMFEIEVRLLTGFVMEEQMLFYGVHFPFVRITSVDATVNVARDAITTGVDIVGSDRLAAILGYSSYLPTIDCLFSMDTSGAANNQTGIYLYNSSLLALEGAGFQNATLDNIHIRDGYCSANGANFSSSGRRNIETINSRMSFADGVATGGGVNAMSIRTASNVFARRANLSNCPGIWTVDIREASTIELRDSDLSNSGSHCVRNEGAAYIHLQRANLTNSNGLLLYCNLPTTSTGGAGGGVVNMINADGTGSGSNPNIEIRGGVDVLGHEGTNLVPNITKNSFLSAGTFRD